MGGDKERRLPGSNRGGAMSLSMALIAFVFTTAAASYDSGTQTYIILMAQSMKPVIFTSHASWYESTFYTVKSPLQTQSVIDTDLGGILHTYGTVFHGFSARLSPSEAKAIELRPGVLKVYPDNVRYLHTTHTPEFLELTNSSLGLMSEANFGEDVIIGVLDTGVWPERESFSDYQLSAIPSKWKGSCVQEPSFNASSCNKKLIGAKYFAKGYEAAAGPVNTSVEFRSPRDGEGHGSHTASTAGGRLVHGASLLGYAAGTARGMAPKARLAIYKVCWQSGCYDSDILAAFDAATADGVDVISLSVGGGVVAYYMDPIAIGAYGAVKNGVFVSCSAGNSGPGPLTVTNVAPWITTVAASTVDRSFPADVKLGSGVSFGGTSLYSGPSFAGGLHPIIYALNASKAGVNPYSASLCLEGTLDPAKVEGKIVLCDRGSNARVAKGQVVKALGALGMILTNLPMDGEGLVADSHVLPGTAVGAKAGASIKAYISSTAAPKVSIDFGGTTFGVKPAPVMSSFSSRGPNPETPQILKPDITAPGVNILAAWTGNAGPTGLPGDERRVDFNIISGTSMSCPHISGIGALLKGARPEWSPAALKSAIMTSSYVMDNAGNFLKDEATGNVSTPFAYGAGHVDPERALDPGLVYDAHPDDYVSFLCALNYSHDQIRLIEPDAAPCPNVTGNPGDLNYPSFSAFFDQTKSSGMLSTSFTRTLTNVGAAKSTYKVSWDLPMGVEVIVEPAVLEFTAVNQKLGYTLKLSTSKMKLLPGILRSGFGSLSWSDGKHFVQSPIVINWQESFPSSP